MRYLDGKVVITGWEIHLRELRGNEFNAKYNSPEQIAKRKEYMETPEMKAKMHESIMRDLERYGLSEEVKQAHIKAYRDSL